MNDFLTGEIDKQKKIRLRKIIILAIIMLIFISMIILTIIYIYNMRFREWCDNNVLRKEIYEENTKYVEIDRNENAQVFAYDKYICILRKKTLEFYNKLGTQVGKIDLDINKAAFALAGRYMAICEENGHKFYLISGKEKIFENQVEANITQINVSKSGYVSVVMSNASYKSIVKVYNKDGKEIFQTKLVTSRIADVSISQDSKYLALAEIDITGIIIKSSIQIISIELAQKNPEQAIIYKYEAPTGKLILNIEYQEKDKLICMYEDEIDMLENETNTQLLKVKNKNLAFMTINNNNKIITLEEISIGEYSSNTTVNILNSVTKKTIKYNVRDVAKSIATSENRIAINVGSELHIIDTNGFLLKRYISNTEINNVVMTDSLVGIIYRDKIRIINL